MLAQATYVQTKPEQAAKSFSTREGSPRRADGELLTAPRSHAATSCARGCLAGIRSHGPGHCFSQLEKAIMTTQTLDILHIRDNLLSIHLSTNMTTRPAKWR